MSALPFWVGAGGLDELLRVEFSVMMEWHLYFVKIYLSTSHSHICIS